MRSRPTRGQSERKSIASQAEQAPGPVGPTTSSEQGCERFVALARRHSSLESMPEQFDYGSRHTAGQQPNRTAPQYGEKIAVGDAFFQIRECSFCLVGNLECLFARHFVVSVDPDAELMDRQVHGGEPRYDKAAGFEPARILFAILHWSLRFPVGYSEGGLLRAQFRHREGCRGSMRD